VQETVGDLSLFGRVVKLKAFQPFSSAENALENINSISEGMSWRESSQNSPLL
jgi:nucleolar protein 56